MSYIRKYYTAVQFQGKHY